MVSRPGSGDRRSGFTLVELLIVMAVILVLAGIMVQTWPAIRERIIKLHCQTNLSKAQKIFMEYGANNVGYLPPATGSGTNGWSHFEKFKGNDLHYVIMELRDYGAGPDIFNCPAWEDYGDEDNYYYTQWDDPINNSITTRGYVLYLGFWPWVTGNNWQWHPWLLPNAKKKADRVDSPGNPPIMSDEMNYTPDDWGPLTWRGFYHWRDREVYPDSPGGGGHTVFLNGAVAWYSWEELWEKSEEDPAPLPFHPHGAFTRKAFAGWAPREE